MTVMQVTHAYCFECKSDQPSEAVGEDCDAAALGFRSEDYYGDGSAYIRTGVHMRGYRCLTCGDIEAEPCIHD